MKIHVTSVPVPGQAHVLAFYAEKHDIPRDKWRWLTVTGEASDVGLLLEPLVFPLA